MNRKTRNTALMLARLSSLFLVFASSLAVLPHRAVAQDELPYTKKPEESPQPTALVTAFGSSAAGWSAGASFPFVAIIRPPKQPSMNVFFPAVFAPNEDVNASVDGFPGIGTTGKSILPQIILAQDGKPLAVKDGRFTLKLNDSPVTKLQVLDQKGHVLTGFDLHTGPKPKPLDNFYVPSSAAIGSTMNVWVPKANIGAPLRPDYMKILIGGREMPTLAASSVDMLTRIDYDTPGPTEIEIKVGPFTFKRSFRVLKLDLSADNLNLRKEEWTTVHIVVGGLQSLRAPAHMKIVVTGAVSMSGAGEVRIQPADVSASGTYTTTRRLDAVEAGTFGVNVTVTVDKEP